MIGGSGVKAQRALLGAVHRMQAWFSTAVLEAKRHAAAVARGGALDVAAAPAGPAAVTLEEVSGPADPAHTEVVAALARSLTSVQIQTVVARDQGQRQTDIQLSDDQYFEPIPYGKIDAPDPGEM